MTRPRGHPKAPGAPLLKVGSEAADERSMPAPLRLPLIATFSVAVTMLAAACGSGSGSPTTPQQVRLGAAQKAQDKVIAMVLNDGDIPGFALQRDGAETLKDQLPRKGARHYAVAKRLVTANWLASEHSIVIRSADGKAPVISDANLFKSAAAAARIWTLEQSPTPGVRMKQLPTPAGSPNGASYDYENNGKLAGFTLGWRRGPVIAYVFLGAHPGETFSPLVLRRVAAFLARAARAQDHRIASVQAGVLPY